jgi:hypothetical protein
LSVRYHQQALRCSLRSEFFFNLTSSEIGVTRSENSHCRSCFTVNFETCCSLYLDRNVFFLVSNPIRIQILSTTKENLEIREIWQNEKDRTKGPVYWFGLA